MANWEQRTEEAITGLRKLVQDLVAPEVSGIKARLDAIREDIKASEKRLEEKIDSSEKRLEEKIDSSEKRLEEKIGFSEKRLEEKIDSAKREILLTVERDFLREENERLKRQIGPQ